MDKEKLREKKEREKRERLEALLPYEEVFRDMVLDQGILEVLENALNRRKERSYIETVELQIGFNLNVRNNHNCTSMSKRLIYPCGRITGKPATICVFVTGETTTIYKECQRNEIDCLTMAELKSFKRNRKKVKKLGRKYHRFFASSLIIRQIPRVLGPQLNRMRKFPAVFKEGETKLAELIRRADSEYIMKGLRVTRLKKSCNACVPVGHVRMDAEEIGMNVRYALSQIVCELPNQWDDLASVYLKSTQTQSVSVLRRYPEISHEHARHLIRFAIRDSDGQFIIYVPNDIQGLLSEFICSAKKETHKGSDNPIID